jgi:hypothetical protein
MEILISLMGSVKVIKNLVQRALKIIKKWKVVWYFR